MGGGGAVVATTASSSAVAIAVAAAEVKRTGATHTHARRAELAGEYPGTGTGTSRGREACRTRRGQRRREAARESSSDRSDRTGWLVGRAGRRLVGLVAVGTVAVASGSSLVCVCVWAMTLELS